MNLYFFSFGRGFVTDALTFCTKVIFERVMLKVTSDIPLTLSGSLIFGRLAITLELTGLSSSIAR